MGKLNKNIEIALEKLEASEEDKKLLEAILYKEHINQERDWESSAPKEIQSIMRERMEGEKSDGVN